MALKTQWQQNAHRALRLIGRFYRWMGWLGFVATALFTIYTAVTQWNMMSQGVDLYTKLWQTLLVGGIVLALGLFLCAMAFLVSLFIEVGSRMMENSLLQTDLLQRLVREQDDDDNVPARLMEQEETAEDPLTEQTYGRTGRR